MRDLDFNIQLLLTPLEPAHRHMSCEAVLVLRGELRVSLNGTISDMKKDDILFIGSETEHCLSGNEDCLICTLTISPEVCWHLTNVFCDSTKIADAAAFQRLRRTFRQLLLGRQSGNGQDNYLQLSLCYHFLHVLETYFRTGQDEEDIVLQMKQYIFRNYRDEISLQTMADHFHFSLAYLSRMFKKKIGVNFLNYLSALRTERAAEEILHTDKGITTIAMEQGFSSLSSFYKQFSEKYGMQPHEYRKAYSDVQKQSEETEEKSQKYLREYLDLEKAEEQVHTGFVHNLKLDTGARKHGRLNMTGLINIGPVGNFSNPSVREAVRSSGKNLGSRYLRTRIPIRTNQLEENPGPSEFAMLDSLLRYCSQERLIPYLVLMFDSMSARDNPDSYTGSFKEYTDNLIWEAVMSYSSDLSICFELELTGTPCDQSVRDEYTECFRYLKNRVRRYYPHGSTGGAGIPLCDYSGRESEILSLWTGSAEKPDFISVALLSYTRLPDGATHQFSDFGNFSRALECLRNSAAEAGMDDIPVHVTEFDSFPEKYNYLNDSRWKACFVIRTYAECLDLAALIGYIKLKDHRSSIRMRSPFSGENGLLTVDNDPKPVFNALRSMRGIGQDIVCSGEGCILSRVTPFRYRALLYNYKHLNDLYYLKKSQEIAPEDLNVYFENLENETFHIELSNLTDGVYQINSYATTEQYGSPLDAWIRKGCPDSTALRHDWLSNYVFPDISSQRVITVSGTLKLDFVLAPLDFIGIEIYLAQPLKETTAV